jgi:hypothetical protein
VVPSGSSVLQSGLDYRLASTASPASTGMGWTPLVRVRPKVSHYLSEAGLGDLAKRRVRGSVGGNYLAYWMGGLGRGDIGYWEEAEGRLDSS